MLEKSQRDLRRSVRRKLALRIVWVTVPLATLAGLAAYLLERDRLGEDVISWTVMQASLFNAEEGRVLDRLEEVGGGGLEAAMRDFAARQPGGRLGRFEAVRVFHIDGAPFAEFVRPGTLGPAEVDGLLEPAAFPEPHGAWCRVARWRGAPFLRVQIPLEGRRDGLQLFMRGVFRPAEGVIAAARARAIRAAGLVMLLMSIVGLALWPLVDQLLGRLGRLSGSLLEANLGTLDALGRALAKRDGDTEEHSLRVTIVSVLLAEEVGLSRGEVQDLIKGAALHDVGKIAIRDEILHKPGKLTEEEYEVMKSHVDHGVDIVSRSSWLESAKDVVHYHHERFGGGGYGRGLEGDSIPLKARIFAIADVFDALASPRPYKEAMDFSRAMEIMRDGRGEHFDPVLFDRFEQLAPEIYERYYRVGPARLERELDVLVDRYFSGGLDALQAG